MKSRDVQTAHPLCGFLSISSLPVFAGALSTPR
jgi:hypothetical protein